MTYVKYSALILALTAFGIAPATSSIAGGIFDKPFDKGGAFSIDKPLNKGGGLSIDKPLDKGGALSINKVYVPEKLRIGRVQSVAEVLIPVCWGSPQDCRGMKQEEAKTSAEKEVAGGPYLYYVIGRFICRNTATNEVSGKQCDVTQASSKSCNEAISYLQSYPVQVGDPCKKCDPNVLDSSEYWDGVGPERIQGGPCSGL